MQRTFLRIVKEKSKKTARSLSNSLFGETASFFLSFSEVLDSSIAVHTRYKKKAQKKNTISDRATLKVR
jgi:hypothetical protein